MLDKLRDMLRSPEAHKDPYAWSATLLAHAFLGVGFAAVLPWWLIVSAYAVWEAVQWRRYGAGAWDCILDWCAVAFGVCVAVALSEGQDAAGALAALVVVLLAGVRRRR